MGEAMNTVSITATSSTEVAALFRSSSSPWALKRKKLLLGTFLHSKTREHLEIVLDTAVAVDQRGIIVGMQQGCGSVAAAREKLLGELDWRSDDFDEYVSGPGQFFFPGFIDTHVHAPQYPNVGVFGESTLLDWLQKYTFPLEASLADLVKARRVYTACVRRQLAHGTTTAAFFATIDVAATNLLADLCLELGQRAFVGRVCMDRQSLCPDYYRDESFGEAVRATLETVRHIRRVDGGRGIVTPILTPRFAPSCSSEAMRGLAALQREYDLAVQTHVSEQLDEVALVAKLFPEAGSYAAVYDSHGLLTARTVLAHAVHITEGEAALVAARRAKVAHCPSSNGCLSSGRARIRWLWDHGIDVGLGTDMSGGYSPSVLEAARQAAVNSRQVAASLANGPERERTKLTVDEVLYLATRGGAEVLGMADTIGSFAVGMQWDAQLIGLGFVDADGGAEPDAGNVDLFGWEGWHDMVAKWLYSGDDRNTKKVWVRGRLVHTRRSQ